MIAYPNYIPANYKRIKVVGSLSELFNEQFGGPDGVNAVLLPRALSHDFNALAHHLAQTEYIKNFQPNRYEGSLYPYFNDPRLRACKKYMKPDMAAAVDAILQDMDDACGKRMRPELRIVGDSQYRTGAFDVWHHDDVASFDSMMGRFMCCYNAPVTEGVRNEDALPVDYKNALAPVNHYSLREGAETFSFQPGDLWRQLSTPNLKHVAPPYIHRAPERKAGDAPRLLLVAAVV